MALALAWAAWAAWGCRGGGSGANLEARAETSERRPGETPAQPATATLTPPAPSTVREKDPMAEHFTGRAMTIEAAVATATDLVVGELLEPGRPDPGAPGETYYDGARLHVIRTLSGTVAPQKEVAFTYTRQTFPASAAESPLVKGETFVFFLLLKPDGGLRAIKILRADQAGLGRVDDALRRRR